jgi:hypothetical protein
METCAPVSSKKYSSFSPPKSGLNFTKSHLLDFMQPMNGADSRAAVLRQSILASRLLKVFVSSTKFSSWIWQFLAKCPLSLQRKQITSLSCPVHCDLLHSRIPCGEALVTCMSQLSTVAAFWWGHSIPFIPFIFWNYCTLLFKCRFRDLTELLLFLLPTPFVSYRTANTEQSMCFSVCLPA